MVFWGDGCIASPYLGPLPNLILFTLFFGRPHRVILADKALFSSVVWREGHEYHCTGSFSGAWSYFSPSRRVVSDSFYALAVGCVVYGSLQSLLSKNEVG